MNSWIRNDRAVGRHPSRWMESDSHMVATLASNSAGSTRRKYATLTTVIFSRSAELLPESSLTIICLIRILYAFSRSRGKYQSIMLLDEAASIQNPYLVLHCDAREL